jgi:hypothetical protein
VYAYRETASLPAPPFKEKEMYRKNIKDALSVCRTAALKSVENCASISAEDKETIRVALISDQAAKDFTRDNVARLAKNFVRVCNRLDDINETLLQGKSKTKTAEQLIQISDYINKCVELFGIDDPDREESIRSCVVQVKISSPWHPTKKIRFCDKFARGYKSEFLSVASSEINRELKSII